ncbi:Myosin type-2 heavy chain 1, partial [Chytriomyces hyalinus]
MTNDKYERHPSCVHQTTQRASESHSASTAAPLVPSVPAAQTILPAVPMNDADTDTALLRAPAASRWNGTGTLNPVPYIRCIKPNMAKTSLAFEGAMVLSQWKENLSLRVLETIKISNAGYPNKLEYEQFASRYEILGSSSLWDMPDRKALCIKIVTTVLSDPSKFQFGKTKVFVKSGQIAFVENRRNDRISYLTLLVQKNIKKFIQQNRYLRIKESDVVLQSAVRGHLAYKHYMEMRAETAAVKLQTAIQGYLCRKRYHAQVRSRSAALIIQRCWRGHIARKTCAIARDRVVLIQSCARKLLARKVFKTLKLQAKDLNK